jgi:hypothetical protein
VKQNHKAIANELQLKDIVADDDNDDDAGCLEQKTMIECFNLKLKPENLFYVMCVLEGTTSDKVNVQRWDQQKIWLFLVQWCTTKSIRV